MNKIKDNFHNNGLGKMKDELPNDTIIEACFLKAKVYCYNTVKGEDEKKLKGITKATIRNQINLEDYKNAIDGGVSKYLTNYTIYSKRHHLETKEQYKIAIDPFDDKGIRDSNGEFRFYQWKKNTNHCVSTDVSVFDCIPITVCPIYSLTAGTILFKNCEFFFHLTEFYSISSNRGTFTGVNEEGTPNLPFAKAT